MNNKYLSLVLAGVLASVASPGLVGQAGWQFVRTNAAPASAGGAGPASDAVSGHVVVPGVGQNRGAVNIFDGVSWTAPYPLGSIVLPPRNVIGFSEVTLVSGVGGRPLFAMGAYTGTPPNGVSGCNQGYRFEWDYSGSLGFNEVFADSYPCASNRVYTEEYWWRFYDSVRSRTVVVVGPYPVQGLNHFDLVTIDGASRAVSVVSPFVAPATYPLGCFTYDSLRDRIVFFQPDAYNTGPALWEFDFGNMIWEERTHLVPAGYTIQSGAAGAFHKGSGVHVYFGGFTGGGGQNGTNSTWHYDGVRFYDASQALSSRPARRSYAGMVYREASDDILMFGGSNGSQPVYYRDTWTYVPSGASSSYDFYGTNCGTPVSSGPSLALSWGSLPVAGQPFTVLVRDCPLFQPVFMLLGLSDTVWNGASLPFSMAPFGMPGCELLTDPYLVFPCTNIVGTAHWQVSLPVDMGGRNIYNQAVVFAPGANSANLLMSNGGAGLVGY